MNKDKEEYNPPSKFGTRHVQTLLLFMGMAIAYSLRVCMSVALVAMRSKESANPNFPEYDWNSSEGNMILSSFFWGYVVAQVPSGHIASMFSAKKLLACGIFISSIFSMLTPWLADYGYIPVICSRVIVGLSQGCLLPCVQTLLSRWVPPLERSRLGSFVINGSMFGTIVAMPISGVLAASAIGWPSIFYLFGTIGIIWGIGFYCMGADHPAEHPKICPNEAHYINSSLGNLNKTSSDEKPKVPWKLIMTSLPMWSLIIAHMGFAWGFYFLLTEMPTYMKFVLNFDISKSGLISALPYLATWLLGFPISYLADWALHKGVSVVLIRKISNSIGIWIPALALVALCVVQTSNEIILVSILVIAVGFNSGVTCGFQLNHMDLSPNFAGPMMSVTNAMATILGIVAPLVTSVIVTNEYDESQWHITFYISAAIYFFTNLFFVIFGKAEIQSWNNVDIYLDKQNTRVSVVSITSKSTILAVSEKNKEEFITYC